MKRADAESADRPVRFILHPRFLQPARIIAFDKSGERNYQLPAMSERVAPLMSKA
ncbi:MAG: hypothetical protein AB1631_28300 [Acidobacteriota bacterium]